MKPTKVPYSEVRFTPDHIIKFNHHPRIKWNTSMAIDFQMVNLPSVETEYVTLKILVWFVSAPVKSNTTKEKLSSVVLELIQRYTKFKMYHNDS
jgi:hypothetical protein